MLRPREFNRTIQAIARSKAKMFEFSVPIERHINVSRVPIGDMLDLTIGMLGELATRPGAGIEEGKNELIFSAQYFNSLLEAEYVHENRTLLILLTASGYYLSGYPGSCQVLIRTIKPLQLESASPFEKMLYSILTLQEINPTLETPFIDEVTVLVRSWGEFLNGSDSLATLALAVDNLRVKIYAIGSDKDLLLIDVVRALIHKRQRVSLRTILVEHTDVDLTLWEPYLSRRSGIKEFWPAQVKFAESGLFKGRSAVIQMPTSAGKTRAIEFIIRSAFLSGRSKTAVIVAPFRALCQEIYNDFTRYFREDEDVRVSLISDVLQNDDLDFLIQARNSVLILTPEKLDLLLKYSREICDQIGLIIYDEGHLIDDDTRGAKYELLLASLRTQLSSRAQVVLMSAVIENAQGVNDWLTKGEGVLIDGEGLNPTNRNIVFVEWERGNANLRFVKEHSIREDLFYVPTVLESHELERRGKERNRRFYPAMESGRPSDTGQVAGYLACRLSGAGLTAIFVGRKVSAEKITRDIVDAYERNFPLAAPKDSIVDQSEQIKVTRYIEKVMGVESNNAKSALLGVLLHHGGIPHGLRLVTEHSLLQSHFNVVVCTSTLAQGVNLPIRYLIVASLYQSESLISTRDFHNLMGRAGRSDSYTEGTVIFADPEMYRFQGVSRSRWALADRVLDRENAEPSLSRLRLLIERPIDGEQDATDKFRHEVNSIRKEVVSHLCNALADIERREEVEARAVSLAEATLGFVQLVLEEEREEYKQIFVRLAYEVFVRIPVPSHRSVYAKSVLTLDQSQEFLREMQESFQFLAWWVAYSDQVSDIDVLQMFWRHLYKYSTNKVLKTFTEDDALSLCRHWIQGLGFPELLLEASAYVRTPETKLKINDIVELCEQGFGYEISTLLGTLYELSSLILDVPMNHFETQFRKTQKFLKYGVSSQLESTIYEIGFCDRAICGEIGHLIEHSLTSTSSNAVSRAIVQSQASRIMIQNEYPEYFLMRLDALLESHRRLS